MTEVDVKNKRIFWRSSHPDMFCKKGALKYLSKLSGKHVTGAFFLKKNQDVGLKIYLKRGSYVGFFLWKFQNSSEQLFYSTAVIRWLWFNGILGNFYNHLRFTQMPGNFDHHSWFYRKYLEFWCSYEAIWKPYLEHDIA